MPEGLEKIGIIIVGSIIIFIGFVLYCLSPFLSEISGSEITSPVFSLLIIMVGVILINVAIVKK